MSGGGRKLNPLEQKLHQAALADPKKTITQKECEALIPDAPPRVQAINFLLGTGLWKALKDTSGNLSYRVVTKKELEVKKDMSGEEGMILSYIQSAGNEGIWTKHLKAKTELHQTVIDRCLKSLTQKQLIKAVKSVKYPTRKIYMLYHLEPSVEMTGGPWYTDNELDTEFIKLLCSACLRFIRDRSTPKQKGGESSSGDQPLYPISTAPAYPTTQQVLTFLSKSRITETQLSTEHVEMLLNVLVLDGEIERVPAFGAAMWDVSQTQEDEADESERERGRRAKAKGKGKEKRKRKEREDSDSPKRDRKRNKRSRSESGSVSHSESDSDDSEEERERRRKRDKKRKSRSRALSSDEDNDQESRKRKKKRSRDTSEDKDADGDVDMSDADRRSRSKSKKRKKSKRYSSGSESDSDEDSDDDRRSRSRSKSKSKSGRKRSSSPAGEEDVTASLLGQDYGAYVYRAVRQERVAGGGGGLAQTPCVRCSVFDFCKDSGPVNARECEYYGSWLVAADVAEG